MFLDMNPGALCEPLTGRSLDGASILRRCRERLDHFRAIGMRNSDRVFIHFGNDIEFFVDLIAIWQLGGCVVPIDPRMTAFEVETLARAARPRCSLWHELPPQDISDALTSLGVAIVSTDDAASIDMQPMSPPSTGHGLVLDQEALILFTSGTTGSPKGVVHTHRSLRARWMSLRQSLGTAAFERTLCLLPTHFGHGLICNCLYPWLSGRDLFILPPFKPEIIVKLGEIIDRHAITFMSSVPTVWRLASKTSAPPQAASLRRVFCGSAPLTESLWQTIRKWTGAQQVFNAYGITETASWLAGTSVSDVAPEDGLIGEAWGGVIRVLNCGDTEAFDAGAAVCKSGEPGHVWVNTPALMQGYLENPELTRRVVTQGWFVTGDIGLVDDRGLLYLRGREREEINKGGMKVYPGDVDAVIERFESTLDVCTFAFDDALLGENIGVAVVLSSQDDETLRDLYQWTHRFLAQHQMPVRWYRVDEIPRTSRGKVNRAEVARQCSGLAALDRRLFSGAGR
jgi:oxalate---CoA ligase